MTEKRILWQNPDGTVSCLIPAPGVLEEVWRKDIPQGVSIVETDDEHLPKDRLFRSAWTLEGGCVCECPEKAKQVAHEIRRAKRAEEFAPHDEQIAKRIPGTEQVAEAERQKIREKYAAVQESIELCSSVDELRQTLGVL